jgi:malate dehydrogenase (oxaloacetate-decarboxylating)(NADP+)
VSRRDAARLLRDRNVYGAMMVRRGNADALISGLTGRYQDTIRPALQFVRLREGVRKVSGLYLLISTRAELYFLADTVINIEPTAEDLAEIALEAAETARRFGVEPRVALLSFSNFGSTRHPLTEKVRRAVEFVRQRAPELKVDGEVMADTAVAPELLERFYPFSPLRGGANVLVFPNLEAANISYKLLTELGGAEAIGPVLMGLAKPVHVLQPSAEVNDIVNMAAIAVVDAQETRREQAPAAPREKREAA